MSPGASFLDWFEGTLARVLNKNGASILSSFVTEESANTFPVLPVSEGKQVFIWFSCFGNQAAYDKHVAAPAQFQERQDQIEEFYQNLVASIPPTSRIL